MSVSRSHWSVYSLCAGTCGWIAQHVTLGGQSHPPAVSKCTWLWFLTLQLEPVTGDKAVTVPHVQDALATVTETPGLDQSHAAFRAKESIYCCSCSSACLTAHAQRTQSIAKSRGHC